MENEIMNNAMETTEVITTAKPGAAKTIIGFAVGAVVGYFTKLAIDKIVEKSRKKKEAKEKKAAEEEK